MTKTLYQELNEDDVIDAVLRESYIGRRVRKEWLEDVYKEGMREGLEIFLLNRFGTISQEIKDRLKESDLEQLRKWLNRASTLNQLQDVFA